MTPRTLSRVMPAMLLVICLMVPLLAQAAAPQRVAIVPFTANAKEDVSFLVKGIRDMLATRLAWREKVTILEQDLVAPALKKETPPYNEEKARRLGKLLNVQVVVYGSITVLGKAVSVDARVLRVDSQGPPLTAFVQAAELDQVIPSINSFAQRINAEIFQRPEAVAALAKAQQSAKAETAPPAAGGDGEPVDKLPDNISPLNPLFMRNLTGVASDRYWRSPRIPGTVTSLAVADVDGDGKNELLVLMPDTLKVYRLTGKYFAVIHEFKNGPRGTYLFVDTADIDHDGKPEIFISNINYRTVESFVLEWQQGGLRVKKKDLPWFFRVQPNPLGTGDWLLGQKGSVGQAFSGPVFRMKYDGSTYVPQEALDAPKEANVFGVLMADLNGGGKAMAVSVGPSYSLMVHSTNGRQLFRSGEAYAASDKFISLFPGSQVEDPGWEDNQTYLPTRLVLTNLDHDQRPEVVVVRNQDQMGGFLEKTKLFYQGTIYSLDWNGMAMTEVWRTPRISGYVTDYTVADVGNVGRPALVLCVGQRGMGGFLDKGFSHIVAFTLKEQKKPRTRNKGL